MTYFPSHSPSSLSHSVSHSLASEIVYARLMVVAKSVKSTSDRCAGRRFGVGQLSGRERDIELLKIIVGGFTKANDVIEMKRKPVFSALPIPSGLIARRLGG